ncbi:MAG: BlaI/MecI/CopY family transcriptional regulator [Patescibacteria group bacterium]
MGSPMTLGTLERLLMEVIWEHHDRGIFSVRELTQEINTCTPRPYAYNTILTVMTHLYEKKLLDRQKRGKTFYYSANVNKKNFLQAASQAIVDQFRQDYGDVALVHFMTCLESIDPRLLEKARKQSQ